MKTNMHLLFFVWIIGATSVSTLLADSESNDANRPKHYNEFIKSLLKNNETQRHAFTRAPAPIADDNSTISNQPLCWDNRLAGYVTSGLQLYPSDMGKVCKYVLDQIIRARYPGSWIVHGQKVAYGTQGPDWQTLTNGNIYAGTNPNACFLRDTYYYVLVLKLYG